jgi:hypothetical protein
MHPSVTKNRPYGTAFARHFLDDLIAAAPDVPIQVAHLAGAGSFDEPALAEALDVFTNAVAGGDPRMKHV